MMWLFSFFALPVTGQAHEASGHAPVHKTAKEKTEHTEPAHEEHAPAEHAEAAAEPEAAVKEHGEDHAAAETEEAPAAHAETEHEAAKAEEHAPAAQESYEQLPFMQASQAEAVAETPSTMGLLMRTTGALLLILGLIATTAWAVRKYGAKPAPSSPELAVLASLPLGDRQQVTALRFGNSLLLIGSTAQAMTLLAARHRRPHQATQPARSVGDMLSHQPTHQPSTQPLPFAREMAAAEAHVESTASLHEQTVAQAKPAMQGPSTTPEQFAVNGNKSKTGDLSQEAA